MRKFLAVVLCLATVPAAAADPRGQWNITIPNQPTYVGTVLIDSQRRATWDSPVDHGRPAQFIGYVSSVDSTNLKISFTDRQNVVRAQCSIMSSDLMFCALIFTDGRKSTRFTLTRVGPGPRVLQAASR